LAAADAAEMAPKFLTGGLPERLKLGPPHSTSRRNRPRRRCHDPTQPWPKDRKVVKLCGQTDK
jgi:hypothetical protein